jgi:SAM-dependent methyltransferase
MARGLSGGHETSEGFIDVKSEDGEGANQSGKVRFVELDAERMREWFDQEGKGGFDLVWISEALSHFPNKEAFFQNATYVLKPGGRLVLADWFRNEGLEQSEVEKSIQPIEGEKSLKSNGNGQANIDRWYAFTAALYTNAVCGVCEEGRF